MYQMFELLGTHARNVRITHLLERMTLGDPRFYVLAVYRLLILVVLRLRALNLAKAEINDSVAEKISSGLPNNNTVHEISLEDSKLGNGGLVQLVKGCIDAT